MKSLELLKQAKRIVTGLIAERTPSVFETCRKAYNDLGDMLRLAADTRHDDGISAQLAAGIDAVVAKLDPIRASLGTLPGEAVKFTADEFAAYFQHHIEKALKEETAPALRRLHSLQSSIDKAMRLEYTEDSGVELVPFVDPWQQASIIQEGGGPKRVSSGVANQAEVKATPGLSLDDVMKNVATTVEKALSENKNLDVGWVNDLSSKEFLDGERRWDFGPDLSKPL